MLLAVPGVVGLFFQNSMPFTKLTTSGSKLCQRREDGVYE